MTEHEQLMRDLANSRLIRTDFRILKAIAPLVASPEWCAWRDRLRDIWNSPEGVTEIPEEPPFGKAEGEVKALRERLVELEDANAALKDALSDAEDRIADLDEEDDFPGPDEKLSDWDVVGVSASERGVLKTAMEEGESVSAAKRRLYPILNEELSRLQNQEALLGASTPESVSARRKEVESLLGILARVGDA